MKETNRETASVNPHYFTALGTAVYCFARLEWNAVYVHQRLAEKGHSQVAKPDYVATLGKKTAGVIARELLAATEAIVDATLKSQLMPIAERFHDLADQRNALIHANPITATDGSQIAFSRGKESSIAEIQRLTEEFAGCSIALNHILHKVL